MALIKPSEAIYPKKHFKEVTVLYDGTQPGHLEFSIARIKLHSGDEAIGIRHDRNTWNENDEEKGYPVVRGGRPTYFILPDVEDLLEVLEKLHKDKKI